MQLPHRKKRNFNCCCWLLFPQDKPNTFQKTLHSWAQDANGEADQCKAQQVQRRIASEVSSRRGCPSLAAAVLTPRGVSSRELKRILKGNFSFSMLARTLDDSIIKGCQWVTFSKGVKGGNKRVNNSKDIIKVKMGLNREY